MESVIRVRKNDLQRSSAASEPGILEAGLVANTNLDGDNCHRGAVVGALLGAVAVTDRIPARFCDRLHDAAALRQQVPRLAV
jgi:ADP-ribosyl-[dinitrogen reductase] hydrolase